MTRLRTVTACHESAARDMLDREWKPRPCVHCHATLRDPWEAKRHPAKCKVLPIFKELAAAEWDALPDGCNRPLQDARAHLASLSPERRSELDKEWM